MNMCLQAVSKHESMFTVSEERGDSLNLNTNTTTITNTNGAGTTNHKAKKESVNMNVIFEEQARSEVSLPRVGQDPITISSLLQTDFLRNGLKVAF